MTEQKALQHGWNLLREFQNKGLVPWDWSFALNRGKQMLGLCRYDRKEISLSKHYIAVATEELIFDTIRHEIAHILAGSQAGHGPIWKAKCQITGAVPRRCWKKVNIESRYKGICPTCGDNFKCNRKLKNMDRRICVKPICRSKREYVRWTMNSINS